MQYEIPVYSIQLVRDGSRYSEVETITNGDDVLKVVNPIIANKDRENLVVLLLNTKNKVIGIETVAIGALNAAAVNLRELFKTAILSNAAAIVLAHNHPSDNPEPSIDDTKLTTRVKQCAKLFDIQLLDHVIATPSGAFYSYFNEKNI